MTPIRARQARDALWNVVTAAVEALDIPVDLKFRDVRLINPADVAPSGMKAAVSLYVEPIPKSEDFLQGDPESWDVQARFGVGIEVLGQDDSARFALADQIHDAISDAIRTDYTLGGVVNYASAAQCEPEDLKQDGMPGDTLIGLSVEVDFSGISPVG